MKEGKRIEELWCDYWNMVSKGTGITIDSVQYAEMRRSFYAGAFAFHTEFISLSDQSEETNLKWLDKFMEDSTDHFKKVLSGL